MSTRMSEPTAGGLRRSMARELSVANDVAIECATQNVTAEHWSTGSLRAPERHVGRLLALAPSSA